jgi:hypothetical protein
VPHRSSALRTRPCSRCFVLDQADDIEDAVPLEFDFEAPATVKEVTLAEIQKLSKLTLTDL